MADKKTTDYYSMLSNSGYQTKSGDDLLTGNAALSLPDIEPVTYPPQPQTIPPNEGRWDLDGDGEWTRLDSVVLYKVINGAPCPQGADCDIDNDGEVTYYDLSLYNTKLVMPPEAKKLPPARQNVTPASSTSKIDSSVRHSSALI